MEKLIITPFNLSGEEILNAQKHSDLVLTITNSISRENYIFFGEVEGLHGDYLLQKSYWKKNVRPVLLE